MNQTANGPDKRYHWVRSIPFFLVHFMPIFAIWTEIHWVRDLLICFCLYYIRMFFITAGYHRYFAHRSYKLNRFMQFLMAFGGTTASQKGVLWWAAHHRHHHKYSDMEGDLHSPKDGFWWSHMGWILAKAYEKTRFDLIPDFAKYPELRFLNKHWWIPPTLLGVAIYFLFGPSALFIGFFGSTIILYHGTFTINSLMHLIGRRRYVTSDTSRNSMMLALLTCGEGWHNNHHHYPGSTSAGFFWWEIDLSYYGLKFMEWLGLVRDVRRPPKKVIEKRLIRDGYADIALFQDHLDKAMKALTKVKKHTGARCHEKLEDLEEMIRNTMESAQKIAGKPFPQAPTS